MQSRNGIRVELGERFGGVPRVAAHLAVSLLAPLSVVGLRQDPTFGVGVAGTTGWLAAVPGQAAVAGCGVGMTVLLVRGLGRGSPAALVGAAALGAMTAGLAVATFRASFGSAAFPDAGLPVAAAIAAVLLLVARLLPDRQLNGGGAGRAAALVGVFIAIEAALAAALLLPTPLDLAPWILAVASGLLAAAALLGAGLPAGLLAGGAAAMALSRPDAIDAVAGLLAFAAAGATLAWTSAGALREGEAAQGATHHDHDTEARDAGRMAPAGPDSVLPHSVLPPAEDEALRLARELRGTIEELLQARRTVELQRAEIARGTSTDALTGTDSRRSILERLAIETAQARRYAHAVALVLVDIDGFGQINHEHGLRVGDEILRELALRLRLRMRDADALGRMGGDSFLAILPHTDERGAAVFAGALRRRLISRPVETPAGELTLSVSIGAAFMRPGMEISDEDLLVAADEALASARAAGGNRIAFDRAHGLVRLEDRRAESPGA